MSLVIATVLGDCHAQNMVDKWSFGLHAGTNLLFNDLNSRKFGYGADVSARYGIERWLSTGVKLQFDELKSAQIPVTTSIPFDYMEQASFPLAALVWIHLSPGRNFSPFIYAGLGGMLYRSKDGTDKPIPDDNVRSSFYIPLGIGFETFAANDVSVVFDIGVGLLDDATDGIRSGAIDNFPTIKLGLQFYYGVSRDDDDDDDGLTNQEEESLHTSARVTDTDGDGLRDGDEVRIGTDPLSKDTDGDGLSDGAELSQYHTDPLKGDTDDDLLSDYEEVLEYRSDPLKKDTDVDGLSDGQEVRFHATDPTKADTDGDGLTDGEEVISYRTDPRNADTDFGGVTDGEEVARRTSPLLSTDDHPRTIATFDLEVGNLMALNGISFKADLALLSVESLEQLFELASILQRQPAIEIALQCIPDGSSQRARALADERTNVLVAWFVENGIAKRRVSTGIALERIEESPRPGGVYVIRLR